MPEATYIVAHSFEFNNVAYQRGHTLDPDVVAALRASKAHMLKRFCRAVRAPIASTEPTQSAQARSMTPPASSTAAAAPVQEK